MELTKEEVELIIDMMNFADDPCGDGTFWTLVYEDEGEEESNRLYDLSRVIRNKLSKIE